MANRVRMTVRLDAAMRRKLERLATREGISRNQAINRLLQRAALPRYRLKPRKVGFGFHIARARSLAAEIEDEYRLRRLAERS